LIRQSIASFLLIFIFAGDLEAEANYQPYNNQIKRNQMKQDMIVILDLGSHENTVLARAIRALGVYSEIYPHDITVAELEALPNVKGIIINGGPNNVIDGVAIDVNPDIYSMGIPVMAAGHDKAACEVKLDAFTDDIEAIKVAVKSFVFDTCKAEANWNMTNFVNDQVELIKRQVGDRKVLLALSGGVDSSVVAALLLKAIGDNLVCVHVNHGLMRKGESENVVEVFRNQLQANLVYVDATDRFLDKLAGVEDPEKKRKIIGGEFIRVFEEEARKLNGIDFLGQGTIYPDIVESGTKTAKMVKSHHNVGGLPEDLKFQLVEPLRQLFKDEVRACGLELGLPYEMVYRQPFPGPGLGVRCLGAITRDRLEAVRESDAILREEFRLAGLDKKVWQYFTVVPDFKSVGVRDNARSFDWPVIIRAVNTVDAMTATIEPVDWPILMKITDRILKEVKNVNRVCYDMSPKPNATIEWE
jgi:GMP synthase (glutamine-hydrolyzing), C-terminal domain or B subunit